VLYATLGGDGRLLRAAVQSGARAVVVQGLPGGGGVSPAMMREMVAAIEAGLPLVLTSRSPFGRLLPAAGGGSGPADVAAAGGILAGDLNAAKARVLLLCALAAGHGPDEIRADFAEVAP
jgi:L-asparaginase